MKIRTQFFINLALFGLTLLVTASSVYSTSREVARLETQQDIVDEIGGGASELGFMAGDYMLHREPAQQSRWETRWAEVSETVSQLSPSEAEERTATQNIGADLRRLKEVFDEVVNTPPDSPQDMLSISWSRMSVQHESLVFNTSQLAHVLRQQKAAIQQQNAQLILTLVTLFGAYLAATYFIVYRQALRGLAVVQAGTEIIGQGNLDHTIPARRRDEVGDLSRAFNKMTADLRVVTTSKSLLEQEITEREAVEEALRESVGEIEKLSEARLQELSVTKKLLDAAESIARWTSLEDLAQGLAESLLKLTPHTRATIDLWDAKRREIQVVASEGELPFPRGSRWPIDQVSNAARQAILGGTTHILDLDTLPVEERGIVAAEYSFKLGLYMPLMQRDEVLGMIVLDDPGQKCEFSEREIGLVRAIAAQAAVAFENARLFEAQRNIADRLQSALLVLPDTVSGIEFSHEYHAASIAARVGGDFYDIFELDGGRVGLVIGDVAGKGLDAAVLTSMVKHTIRAHANEHGKTTDEILRLTNQIVYKGTPAESFVTVFFGVLERETGRMVYSSAGHTSGAIACTVGEPTRLPANGPILGALADAEFDEAEAYLGGDETLLLYTDGLTEARRDKQLYGEERLFELLANSPCGSASELVRAVVADVMDYADNHLGDDLAILAVKCAK